MRKILSLLSLAGSASAAVNETAAGSAPFAIFTPKVSMFIGSLVLISIVFMMVLFSHHKHIIRIH